MPLLPVQMNAPNQLPAFSFADAIADQFVNDGRPMLLVNCAGPRTLIVRSPHPNRKDFDTYPLATGFNLTDRIEPLAWNDPVTERVTFTFDNPVGVQVAVWQPAVIGFDPAEALGSML